LENGTEGHILDVLKKSDISLTIEEIAKKTEINRITASKYLAIMDAKGIVKFRNVGKAKLYSIKSKKTGR
jgi:response regulator of citrate/malate metabolism